MAVIIMILVIAGLAIVIHSMARLSGRMGHWYHQSQLAFDLADAAMKEATYLVETANSRQRAQASPLAGPALVDVFDRLQDQPMPDRPVVLFSTKRAAGLPASLTAMVEGARGMSPVVEVTQRVLESRPLEASAAGGIRSDMGERTGRVQTIARASVRNEAGLRVTRTITLERNYKLISILPPLLGRFVLFVHSGPSQDPNIVRMSFDPQTGETTLDPSGPRPLVVTAGTSVRLVEPGTHELDRTRVATAFSDAQFLDRQGWVYLGGTATGPWRLGVAHGLGEAGESVLLPGNAYQTDVPGFQSGFQNGFANVSGCAVDFRQPNDGLYYFHHGCTTNFEIIGLDPTLFGTVQRPGGSRKALTGIDAGSSSCLRLFGAGGHAVSPTIVFGPVVRSVVRRASVRLTVGASSCRMPPGTLQMNILEPGDHGVPFRGALQAGFGSLQRCTELATRRVDDPFVRSLDVVLDVRPSGKYRLTGELIPRADGTPGPAFASTLLPWLGSLPQPDSIPDAALERLLGGDLDSPGFYQGSLGLGLEAFHKGISSRMTFRVTPEAFRRRLLRGRRLDVPGVVLLERTGSLVLDGVDAVARGGVLVTQGPIQIDGPVVRGAAGEPLTLVSLSGDIAIGPAATTIEAYLVALNGTVRFPAADVTVWGGLACREMDVDTFRSRANRSITYAPDFDVASPDSARRSLRSFYGGDDRLAVGGDDAS